MRSEEQRVEEIGIILFCLTVQSTESKMLPDGFVIFIIMIFSIHRGKK